MKSDDEGLLSIRCPFVKTYISKHTGKERSKECNKQCVKVKPGSSGEAYCSSCDKRFDFKVPHQGVSDVVLLNNQEVQLTD